LSVWESSLNRFPFRSSTITQVAEGVRVWLASYKRTILR
jgi:hypothetical protein